MKYVYVLCEGPTERNFVEEVLYGEAEKHDIYINAVSITTSVKERKYTGGVSKYSKIRENLIDLCRNQNAVITSMFDLYGLPSDTPGYANKKSNHVEWAKEIEHAVNIDIGAPNLHFNLLVHEFEALLYADPEAFRTYSKEVIPMMERALKKANGNPEDINSEYSTSPSHRILDVFPSYSKPADGGNIIKKIPLSLMREKCAHFNDWLMFLGI